MRTLALLFLCLSSACGVSAASGAGTVATAPEPRHGEPETPVARAAPSEPRLAAILEAHNIRRAEHCAPSLAWSDELARAAHAWAEQLASSGCAFEHNDTDFGENLWAGTRGLFAPAEVVDAWYREVAHYRFERGRFDMETGHFTQLVWRSTRAVGCGSSTCNGMEIWVCNYDPPGNVQGEFGENVLPTSCRR